MKKLESIKKLDLKNNLERVHELKDRFQNWSNAVRSSHAVTIAKHHGGLNGKYTLDDFGILRDMHGNPYVYDSKTADNVGAQMTEQLYAIMQREPFALRKYYFDPRLADNGGFFFASEDVSRNRNLVVLIHGSGMVRAGQWSRRLILSEGLAAGSQLEYIRACRSRGWAVVVMNCNHNLVNNMWHLKPHVIKGSKRAEEHGLNVWRAVIAGSRARRIAIIAHNYGGKVVEEILFHQVDGRRVRAICLLDSMVQVPSEFLSSQCCLRNWIPSTQPIGSQEPARLGIACDSAGTMEHERVPAFAMDRVFRFVDERFLASETQHVTRFEEEHGTYAIPASPPLSPPIVPPRKRTEPRTWAHADAQRFLGNGNNGNNGNNGRPSVKDLAMEFQRRQTDAL